MGTQKTKAVVGKEPQPTASNIDNGESKSKIQILETVATLTDNVKKVSSHQVMSPVAHSSMHSATVLSAHKIPSFERRSDGRIQAEVQGKLHLHNKASRSSDSTKSKTVDVNLKS